MKMTPQEQKEAEKQLAIDRNCQCTNCKEVNKRHDLEMVQRILNNWFKDDEYAI